MCPIAAVTAARAGCQATVDVVSVTVGGRARSGFRCLALSCTGRTTSTARRGPAARVRQAASKEPVAEKTAPTASGTSTLPNCQMEALADDQPH